MAPIDRFHRQVVGTLQMLRYFLLMQETFPHAMLQLTSEQTRNIGPQILAWIEFSREIYQLPELGCDPPRPMPVDADCPPHALSDQIRERVGKNTPFFDFVNAPFTHPIGTQISITCISSAWNAYDTFVNETSNGIKTEWPDNDRVKALLQAEEELKKVKPNDRLSSDDRLAFLEIAATTDDFEKAACDTNKPHFKIDQVERLLVAGKDIRSTFTHRCGEPTERLQKMMCEYSFEDLGFRMTPEGFEVTLLASRNIVEVILLKAVTIASKARAYRPLTKMETPAKKEP